jgi:hypothetical protein
MFELFSILLYMTMEIKWINRRISLARLEKNRPNAKKASIILKNSQNPL